jgi:hypothetical protein
MKRPDPRGSTSSRGGLAASLVLSQESISNYNPFAPFIPAGGGMIYQQFF